MLAMWGVGIARIYEVIHQSWTDFQHGFKDGEKHRMLEGYVLHSETIAADEYPLLQVIVHKGNNVKAIFF